MLSRHRKVLVLRYDFFLANRNIEIRSLTTYLGAKLKANYHKDTKIYWVREEGHSDYNKGLHYHFVMAIPYITERHPSNIGKSIRDTVKHYFEKEENNPFSYTVPLEEINNNSEATSVMKDPSFKMTGFFILRRNDLNLEAIRQQKQDIEEMLYKGQGYKYLDISSIKDRKHQPSVVLGGVIHECIFAISYLAKKVTKETLPDRVRAYSPPMYVDNSSESRKAQIAIHTKEVDQAFMLLEESSPMFAYSKPNKGSNLQGKNLMRIPSNI
jgi:hypothetical protein